jgi:hypothetical protein
MSLSHIGPDVDGDDRDRKRDPGPDDDDGDEVGKDKEHNADT